MLAERIGIIRPIDKDFGELLNFFIVQKLSLLGVPAVDRIFELNQLHRLSQDTTWRLVDLVVTARRQEWVGQVDRLTAKIGDLLLKHCKNQGRDLICQVG